jgi:hypothetical protein
VADAGLPHGGREALSPFFRKHVVHRLFSVPHWHNYTDPSSAAARVQLSPESGPMLLDKSFSRTARSPTPKNCAKFIELPEWPAPRSC